jgi:hypothetical protein
MKKLIYLFSLTLLALVGGCKDFVTEKVTYKINEPIFMSPETFRNSVKVSPKPHAITSIGKMCFYNNYLYISEPGKGIHIINNADPAHPQVIGFIELMGNADLAIRNNRLYADSYIDLVWFDVSNPAQPELQGRLDSIFPTALPVTGNNYGIDYLKTYGGTSQGIIVGWKLTEKTEDVNHYTGGWLKGGVMYDGLAMTASPSTNASSTGLNGSMSRFTIYNDRLYSVINNNLNIFDLTGEKPKKAADNMYVGWNVETIFSYKTNLFFGTSTGLIIYSVANPLKPVYQSCITHAYACDPVVVDNDLAYVTLHSGSICDVSAKENSLIIIDVKDVKNPVQLVTYNLTNPKGLGIDSGKLFLCDDGLKIYKLSEPQTIMANQLAHYKGMDGYDVIPFNNTLMMIANDGLYQYDYSDISNIKQISKIAISK